MTYTPERIAELRAIEAAATPGEWLHGEYGQSPYIVHGPKFQSPAHCYGSNGRNNASFIAAARNELLGLLREIERLQAEQIRWTAENATLRAEWEEERAGKSVAIQSRIVSDCELAAARSKIAQLTAANAQLKQELAMRPER